MCPDFGLSLSGLQPLEIRSNSKGYMAYWKLYPLPNSESLLTTKPTFHEKKKGFAEKARRTPANVDFAFWQAGRRPAQLLNRAKSIRAGVRRASRTSIYIGNAQ